MEDKKTHTINLEVDLKYDKVIGQKLKEDSDDNDSLDIGIKIAESINKAFRGISDSWLDEFSAKVESGDISGAYTIFDEKKQLLQFSNKKEQLQKLKSLDPQSLSPHQRKEFVLSLVAFASKIGCHEDSDRYVNILITEFSNELEPILLQNLYLEKANNAARKGLFNSAATIYNKIIGSADSDAGTRAWAYQGLSLIANNDDDKILFINKAIDRHLESGARDEAIKNIVKLSELYSSNNPAESNRLLDYAISLYDSQRLIDRELSASLNHKKASYLYEIGRYKLAFEFAEQACNLRAELFGNEAEQYSSYKLAENLAKITGDNEKQELYRSKSEELLSIIKDEDSILRHEIALLVESRKPITEDIEDKVRQSDSKDIKCSVNLYKAINSDLPFEEGMALLDEAKIYADNLRDKTLLATVHFAIAEQYRKNNNINDALSNYNACLQQNAFYRAAYQNCTAMLFNNNNWGDAEKFIKERIDLFGELPTMCFAYGRTLYENGKYSEALTYFKKSGDSVDNIDKFILDCAKMLGDDFQLSKGDFVVNKSKSLSINEFTNALAEFSSSISSDSRMHFWTQDGKPGKYKWKSGPEELGKQMLITFLNGKFGKKSVDIIQETRAGAGIIDLYVILSGGIKIVIELKMCGGGYSSSYALSGTEQIVHYLDNKDTNLGFLVVFDGRLDDYGKHFKAIQTINRNTIYSVAIDMRPNVIK